MTYEIYGGQTSFTQWQLNRKLVVTGIPVGADVQFYNDPYEDDPLMTEVYEMVDETSGETILVCNVPNILLTTTAKIKVSVDSKVRGPYGVMYSVIGSREKYFTVEEAEQPADYVYEETELVGGSCSCDDSDNVSEDEVETIINNYFSDETKRVTDEEVIALLSDDE